MNYNDLQREVDRLNEKYCKYRKNKLVVSKAYGGFAVYLTGKTKDKGLKTAVIDITDGHDTIKNTLNSLYKVESKGWLQSDIKYYDKNK